VPIELSHLWDYFQQMCRMRQNNGMCVSRLSSEIVTWQQLTGMTLAPFELDVIWRLDAIFVAHHSKKVEP